MYPSLLQSIISRLKGLRLVDRVLVNQDETQELYWKKKFCIAE